MRSKIDFHTWKRKEHYTFFKQFEQPFFGVTVRVDCTQIYARAKAHDESVFLHYLHKALLAVNEIENFKYRIVEDSVYLYDRIDGSPTIARPDETFGFSYIKFNEDFGIFSRDAKTEIARVRAGSGLEVAVSGENVVHFSTLPWLDFTTVEHPKSLIFPDSCPKIVFGKMTTNTENLQSMPVSIHGHHALMDGMHIGQFVKRFQELLNL
ncbi:CatA-like O-acetyltransferase [Leeuwenhoekiella sp. W20_SRS_FM14]|uniref:CatA-like O-acetyltransferase n=1 Tax=Leeuwenhoekiella sp. W20_SRS_FM14 TaxID=3240270 RepID=UPI003F9756FD